MNGTYNIEVTGSEAISEEGLVSYSKLRTILLGARDSMQAPITFSTDPTLQESSLCFDGLKIKQKL